MKYTAEMGSGVIIYIQGFIKISSGVRELIGRGGCMKRQFSAQKQETCCNSPYAP
jgi:hypothetical protein